jgi:Ubiquitin-2 like Rad60 SUMO-like
MSAPTDPVNTATTTSAPAPAVDSSHIKQPNDAVPMESMENNPVAHPPSAADPAVAKAISSEPAGEAGPATRDNVDSNAAPAVAHDNDHNAASPIAESSRPTHERQESVLAIGPAQDEIKAVTPGVEDTGPVCNITLLLTTGSRHPYKISAKYLARRNVPIPEETESGQPDPFSISVYTLKELILREWRSEWEDKPASPGSIRLIHFGKLLDDKEPLRSMC